MTELRWALLISPHDTLPQTACPIPFRPDSAPASPQGGRTTFFFVIPTHFTGYFRRQPSPFFQHEVGLDEEVNGQNTRRPRPAFLSFWRGIARVEAMLIRFRGSFFKVNFLLRYQISSLIEGQIPWLAAGFSQGRWTSEDCGPEEQLYSTGFLGVKRTMIKNKKQ